MQFGEYFTTCSVTCLHDLVVHVQQVVAAHARLARHARRDDDDVGVGASRRSRRRRSRARPIRRSGTPRDVERDARRLLVGDVDDDDVGELLVGDAAGHRRADVAGAAHHCHFAIHVCSSNVSPRSHEHGALSRSRCLVAAS